MRTTAPTNKPSVVRRVRRPCVVCRGETGIVRHAGRNQVRTCAAGHVNIFTAVAGA